MTKMIYNVQYRPKKNECGYTQIGWESEGERDAVSLGGYLETRRTLPGKTKQYSAHVLRPIDLGGDMQGKENINVGNNFETRAQAAFAIWRSYYQEVRTAKECAREFDQMWKEAHAINRERVRAYRATPEGKEAYRIKLNRNAKIRRDNMTPEQKAEIYSKRRAKRAHEKEYGG